jgi:hypothetical protein
MNNIYVTVNTSYIQLGALSPIFNFLPRVSEDIKAMSAQCTRTAVIITVLLEVSVHETFQCSPCSNSNTQNFQFEITGVALIGEDVQI